MEDAATWLGLARVFHSVGQPAEAAQAYEKAAALQPAWEPEVMVLLSKLYWALGNAESCQVPSSSTSLTPFSTRVCLP